MSSSFFTWQLVSVLFFFILTTFIFINFPDNCFLPQFGSDSFCFPPLLLNEEESRVRHYNNTTHYVNSVIHKLPIYWEHSELRAVICESPVATERLRAARASLSRWLPVNVIRVRNTSELLTLLSAVRRSFSSSLPCSRASQSAAGQMALRQFIMAG